MRPLHTATATTCGRAKTALSVSTQRVVWDAVVQRVVWDAVVTEPASGKTIRMRLVFVTLPGVVAIASNWLVLRAHTTARDTVAALTGRVSVITCLTE
jgi:hypothetical protein